MRGRSVLLLGLLTPVAVHSQRLAVSPAAQQLSASQVREAQATDRVAGRVLRATDKRPIPGATVTLGAEQGRRTVLSTRTDAEGRYSFDPQLAGKYNLHATATGYLGGSYLQHENFFSAVVLGAGLKTDDLTLELTPNASITGRIVDDAGEPVPRALPRRPERRIVGRRSRQVC